MTWWRWALLMLGVGRLPTDLKSADDGDDAAPLLINPQTQDAVDCHENAVLERLLDRMDDDYDSQ